MSAVRLLVLGVVRQHGRAHGYQVRRTLLEWRADTWGHVAPGSIYQALRTLAKHGLLAPVATESGTGPERTVYRLTDDGETQFFHLLRTGVTDPGSDDALNASFAFLHLLTRAELRVLLDFRVRALRARLPEVEEPPGHAQLDAGLPPQIEALSRLYASRLRDELDWVLDLADRVRDGAYAFADDELIKVD